MIYFVTGATGFIGKRLVARLLARPDATVYFLTRAVEQPRLQEWYDYWGCDGSRAIAVVGDLTQPELGVAKADVHKLKGRVDHFFHLAAIYDLKASAEEQQRANVDGTRNTVRLADELGVRHFHLVSSIASAGLFEGLFREDMFDEAENLENPYFRTKHDSEGIVRRECTVPWRIFRPAIVVGDSRTGEMDKIDGPYYFFKLIQKMRRMFPSWMPTIGIEGGRINVVPVDFVVAAMDHIAHLDTEDGQCFHLTDPTPMRVGDLLNTFARAAHAPEMAMRVNAALLGFIPRSMRKAMFALTPVRRIRTAVMKDLGLPDDILDFINYPTRFDCRETQRALKGTGIAVPPLDSYAWRLWDYWERHLDPDLFVDQTLRGQVEGKVVLVTGGSSGIGKATIRKMAEAGAIAVTIARDAKTLDEVRKEFENDGLRLITHAVDVADPQQCEAFVKFMNEEHGGIDILVNNAGRSIRRGIENSFDRFHDFERTMEVNYFGALRLTMGFLPGMIAKRKGQVINISSIGVLTNAPRFSAYVASKAAMDAWARCAASEFADRGIEFTTINMPLVKTPMIAPTKLYDQVPTLTPDEAADMIVEAIIHKPVRIATRLGIFGALLHSLMPKVAQVVMNTSFRMFPDSSAAAHKQQEPAQQTADQVAFSQMMRGIHF
ncbi:MAG TPA: SDR family oxidoreductase [Candidatus Accumulibacter phosphatis]|nr:MAG: Fatty acyl-CoA reductase [Candidatus Accumulibacter sp. SK-11]HAY27290.1 short chain dehydrogenase [Accumulibacter sp.]HCN67476.1 short chain dehydrogenase [Accumulibacter sp.]HRL76443.1 SDR family oxidoreductase [Candidatus Accumulibacter phosphatis]HRQ94412.1 SDR family oxidoreductase [Candidatus Accumulibacter phosphatis]